MNVFQLFEAVRCYSKSGHPIVASIGNKGDEAKIFWLVAFPMIIGKGWLSNIQFIFVLTVRSKEEGDASEEQAEQSSNIRQNNVKFSDSSLDGKRFSGPIDVKVDISGSWQRNSTCGISLDKYSFGGIVIADRK